MPNYDYQCAQCGHQEEILQKMTDAPLKTCPQCQQPHFKRKFGRGIGLQFQGSGFYCTDYSQKPSSDKSSGSSSSSSTPPSCGCGKTSCSA